MNKLIKSAVFFSLLFILFSCKKNISEVQYTGGTPPVLTTIAGADTASYLNADKTILTLNWTNPNYQFSTGVSSQDVTYNIMIDTAGSDFSKPYQIVVSKNLSYSFISSQLNDIMLNQLNLQDSMQHTLEFKIKSSLVNGSVPLISNSVQYSTTAYSIPPKVTPPALGTLFIVGSAVGSWDNPIAETNVPSQQFQQVSSTEYTITTQLIGDGEYKFIETNGSWDQQWSVKDEQPSGDPTTFGTDFVFNGGNIRAPLVSGSYLIDVDFQKGKFTLTKQ